MSYPTWGKGNSSTQKVSWSRRLYELVPPGGFSTAIGGTMAGVPGGSPNKKQIR